MSTNDFPYWMIPSLIDKLGFDSPLVPFLVFANTATAKDTFNFLHKCYKSLKKDRQCEHRVQVTETNVEGTWYPDTSEQENVSLLAAAIIEEFQDKAKGWTHNIIQVDYTFSNMGVVNEGEEIASGHNITASTDASDATNNNVATTTPPETTIDGKKLTLVPRHGVCYPMGMYQDVPVQMIADMSEGSTPGDSDGDARASIRATTYTLQSPKASAIQAFLKEAIAHYRAKLDCAKAKQYLYVLADASVNPPIFRQTRLDRNKTFKGMFFPEKDKVLAGFDNFRHRRGNHGKNESPWKLTYLLYGPPGTGKTSFAKALADHSGRSVVQLSLSRIRTKAALDAVIGGAGDVRISGSKNQERLEQKEVIYLIDDADAMGAALKSRTDKEQGAGQVSIHEQPSGSASKTKQVEDPLTLADILEKLDGMEAALGRVMIFCTNHVDQLDEAIKRPGRVNLQLKMSNVLAESFVEMLEFYFDGKDQRPAPTADELKRARALLSVFPAKKDLDLFGVSPAFVQQACFAYATVGEVLKEVGLELKRIESKNLESEASLNKKRPSVENGESSNKRSRGEP